jgi:hypothetical protein
MAVNNDSTGCISEPIDTQDAAARLRIKYPGKEVTLIGGVPGVWIPVTDEEPEAARIAAAA